MLRTLNEWLSADTMEPQISVEERTYLRELAGKQAQYAALPVMEQRKRMWYDLNDARSGARPPVIIEPWTFDRDFLPDSILRCKSDLARNIERQLLRNTRNHELIDDDKVIPDAFVYGWQIDIDAMGVKIASESAKDSHGANAGYRYLHPIKSLKDDMHILKPAVCRVNREGTAGWKAFLEDLFDGVLPVRRGSWPFSAFLTQTVVQLMGMEAFFLAMYDTPDEMHRLMAYLRDNALRIMRWAEGEGLLTVNNGNHVSFGSSYNFTTRLPKADFDGTNVRLCDMWGAANSQETVGISPEMFHEFCFPYYRDVCQPLGLVYYGCCEPVHPIWDDVRRLPNLKKVSISRWCDQKLVAEALEGTEIVFSRKPDPKFLGVDVKLDEDGWRAHIRETLEATRGVFTEFIVRDVYTVHGDLGKVRRAAQLAREEIDRHWRP